MVQYIYMTILLYYSDQVEIKIQSKQPVKAMETVEIFYFNSEDFSAVYLLQNMFFRDVRLNIFSQFESIKLKPRLYVLRHPEAADKVCSIRLGMHVGLPCQDILKLCDLAKSLKGPYAILILLNPNGTHRNCRLSENVSISSFKMVK